jgi:hypothetical protein
VADEDPQTLSTDQVQRELAERRRAREAEEPAEQRTHERRADKHSYLREKLREQREADEQDG